MRYSNKTWTKANNKQKTKIRKACLIVRRRAIEFMSPGVEGILRINHAPRTSLSSSKDSFLISNRAVNRPKIKERLTKKVMCRCKILIKTKLH